MESMLCWEHTCLGGIKQFGWPWGRGRPFTSKTEENVNKLRALVRSDRLLTVTMIGSELNLNHQTVHDILNEELVLPTLGCCITATLPVTLPSPWTKFWQKKGYFSGFAAPMLAWSESVWLLPFPKTQIPHQSSSFWNRGQHPKGRDRPAEGTSTWRIPALLPGVGATYPAVCGFTMELLWSRWCLTHDKDRTWRIKTNTELESFIQIPTRCAYLFCWGTLALLSKCEGAPTNTWPNGITHQNQYTYLWFAKYVWSSWRWA
jgi:hypothetical protein